MTGQATMKASTFRRRGRAAAAGVCALWLLGFPVAGYAQSVSFAGIQTELPLTVAGKALNFPYGVAVSGAGVFIADSDNNRVVEIPAGCTSSSCQIALSVSVNGLKLNHPQGVAVDGSGDVFIADTFNNRVVGVQAGTGTEITLGSGLKNPESVAADKAGDLWIADTNNSRVVAISAAGVQTTVGTGLSFPAGVAVDAAGDVFIADTDNSRVVEVPAGCTSSSCQTTVGGSGLCDPVGVAVDGAGNVFIANSCGPSRSWLMKAPPGGGVATALGTGLSFPFQIAVDVEGDVFIADSSNNRVVEVEPGPVTFGNINVCPAGETTPAPCSGAILLDYSVNADTTFGSASVLTQGAPNLDFTPGSTATTCTGSVTAVSACFVDASFAPLAPGLRMGAVQLVDNSGNVQGTTLIQGIGQGPAVAFYPGAGPKTVLTAGSSLTGIAVDAAGDLFIAADGTVNSVLKVSAAGVQSTVASGLNVPNGVAVDGAGDVLIADTFNNRVLEVSSAGVQTTLPPVTVNALGLNEPFGVAVDGAGDVFIADWGNGRVVEIAANGTQTTVGTGLITPVGVAVDTAGDVFIADSGLVSIVEVPADCTSSVCQTTVGSGLVTPSGVAVDAAGDLFIVEAGTSGLAEVPAGCTIGACQTSVAGTAGLSIADVAVDAAGDIFITNPGVVELPFSQPPTLTFATTAVGSISSDSPQLVTVQNVGNQTLAALTPGLSIPANFTQVTGSPADCTTSFSLIPGASCELSINFTPLSVATFSIAAILTDNALNASPSATQSITLQGTGAAPPSVTVTVAPSSATLPVGTQEQFSATVTGATNTAVTWSVAPGGAGGSISATGLYTAPLSAGTDTVIATSLAAPGVFASATVTVVAAQPPSPTITSVTPNIGYPGQQGLSVTITGANFVTGASSTTATFGGGNAGITVVSTTVNSPTSATAVLNIAATTAPGSYDVVVAVSGAPPPATLVGGFTVALAINESVTLNDAVNIFTTQLINVSAPVASFSTGSLGFGSVSPGATGTQIITVSNVGQGSVGLTLSSAVISQAGTAFALGPMVCSNFATSFATTLSSGGACQVAISYTAPASGTPPTGTITFTDNAALSNLTSTFNGSSYMQTIALNGSGTTAPPPTEPPAIIPLSINESVTLNDGVNIFSTQLINVNAPVASFSTSSLGFGSVTPGATGTQIITVSNVGQGSVGLTLSSAVISQVGTAFALGPMVCSNFATSFATALASGGACQVAVSYTAPASGTPPMGTITFTDNAALSNLTSTFNGSSYTQTIALNASGTTAPQPTEPTATIPLSINESVTLNDLVSFTVSQSIAFGPAPTVVVFGQGQVTATASSGLPVIFSSTTPSICSINGSTVTDLAVGSCIVAANQVGNGIYSPAPQVMQTISILGLFPLAVTFGDQLVGSTSATQTITLVNTGLRALTVGTITTTGDFSHPSKTCGASLPSGSSCTVSIAFAPKATGPLNGTLTVGANGTVALSGTGIVPLASITPAKYMFPDQQVGTTSTVQTFTYTNTTNSNTVPVSITVSSLALTGAAPTNYAIASDGCSGMTLAPAATCEVGVTFTPSAANNRTANLTVTDETGGAATATASLSGMGVAPTATLTGNAAFGKQPVGLTSALQTLTYQNTGIGPISVSFVTLSGTAAGNYVIASDACTGATLVASASCNVGVTLTPSAAGNQPAKLTVTDLSGGAPAQSIALSGTGTAPTISLGSGTLAYGAVRVATVKTLTLTNSGTAPLVISTIALTTGTQFNVTGGTCAVGGVVGNGGSCTVIVRFTPSGTTAFGDTLTVSGTGVGAAAPTYTASRAMTGS
jgi:sugar lactone lactonase YvrE